MRGRGFLLLFAWLLLASGCASIPLSEEALSRVDPTVELAEVRSNPAAFEGRTLLLGGQILENQTGRDGSVLEILQYRLDRWGRPAQIDEHGGRFLVKADRFLDPEIFAKGKFVTLTGTVVGSEARPLQDTSYTYPVLRLGEAHLWREARAGYDPYFYGPAYPYYYPYYDPFWYPFGSPWYDDPFWYHRRPWRW